MVGRGIEQGVQYALGKSAVHHLFHRVIVHLAITVLLMTNALGDAGEKLQVAVIARLGAEDMVQRDEDFRQAPLSGHGAYRCRGLWFGHFIPKVLTHSRW